MMPENREVTIKVWRLYRVLTSEDDNLTLDVLERSVEDTVQRNEVIGLIGLGKRDIMAGLKKIYGIPERRSVDISELDNDVIPSKEKLVKHKRR